MTANLPEFRRRRRLDDILTTLRMPRRFTRKNFTSGWRRRPISSSMLKVPIDNNKSAFLSAILLLPEFHCSLKLIAIVSWSRPLPASRPASHVSKTHCFQAAITWRELYYFAFLRSSSIMVDYIKSFGREQSRQHKQSAVLRTFDVQSLNFCLEGKT